MRQLSRFAIVSTLLASTFVLNGCLPLAATGMAVTAKAALDRRTIGAQTEDTEIEFRARNRIAGAVQDAGGVSVTSYNRRVLLTGQVRDEEMKRAVEAAVAPTPGVRALFNELEVGPRATLPLETRDAALTARVKTSFLEQRVLSINAVKVVTESEVVYLMGLVSQREGPAYAQTAARVSGVRRVVTLFEYVTEDELRLISSKG
jgi:osmotically-inducible protein OsmY